MFICSKVVMRVWRPLSKVHVESLSIILVNMGKSWVLQFENVKVPHIYYTLV